MSLILRYLNRRCINRVSCIVNNQHKNLLFLNNGFVNNEIKYLTTTVTPIQQQQSKSIAERSFFDTNLLIKELKAEGFTQEQAESICRLFKDIVNFVINEVKAECVTKSVQELAIQQVMIHIGSLKKDMVILEKSEFSTLRNENEKIVIELKNLREQLQDEIIKLKSGFTLDLNLEKSRVTETESEISIKLQRIESRIDTEIANLRATFEKHKLDIIRYGVGIIISISGLVVAIYRLFI